MQKVDIFFNTPDINEIAKVLDQVKEQIRKGEFHYKDNPGGYLPNKYNPIDIRNPKELWDSDGYSIGHFRIRDGDYLKKHKESD